MATAAVAVAATTETSCVLPPTKSFTAVRESAPVMANPPDNPDIALAMPRAFISWLASIS